MPTGFAPMKESIAALVKTSGIGAKIKRYDIAGRKVVFYIEDLRPDESLSFSFQAKALYPVQAKGVISQAYSYYRPEWKGETLGVDVAVR